MDKQEHPEGLDEFSRRCAAVADELHALVDDFDDEADPAGLRQAILVAHLHYVLNPDVMRALHG